MFYLLIFRERLPPQLYSGNKGREAKKCPFNFWIHQLATWVLLSNYLATNRNGTTQGLDHLASTMPPLPKCASLGSLGSKCRDDEADCVFPR